MERRRELRNQVKKIMKDNPFDDPHKMQMKRLEAIGIESMLMLDQTLDKMNDTNKALDTSNKKLARSNLTLQRITVAIAILALLVSLALGVTSLKSKQTVKIEVNGREIIQRVN